MRRRWIKITLFGVGLGLCVTGFMVISPDYPSRQNRINAARMFVNHGMKVVLEVFRNDVGRYPTQAEGLGALLAAPPALAEKWRGPYLDGNGTPRDPWDRPFVYRFPAKRSQAEYDLFSLGPDGVESDDDIGNWQKTTSPQTPPGSP